MGIGSLLGDRYRLDAHVDGGGMGEVWRGTDTLLDRTVAVKVMHASLADDPTFRRRFRGEARAVAALRSPGVVNLYDYGEVHVEGSGTVSYLVMEFVPGRSLRDTLTERGALDVDATLDVVAQAAQALHDAHREGIVHRDVKPGNLLLDETNGQVKVVDFGLARARGGAALTDAGMIMGSVAYVAPELLRGDAPTPTSDVYALGVVAYECLSGRKPFGERSEPNQRHSDSDAPMSIIEAQLHTPPPPLPDDVPQAAVGIVMRALEKDPARRWQSAADFAAACRELRSTDPIDVSETAAIPAAAEATVSPAAGPRGAVAPSPQPSPDDRRGIVSHRRRSRKGRILVAAATLTALVIAAGIAAGWSWSDEPAGHAADGTAETAISDAGPDSDAARTPGGSTSPSPSESESGAEADPAPDQTDSDTPSTSPSDDPTSTEPKASVPELIGMNEDEAFAALDDKGFANTSSYAVGDGDHACSVVEQDPEAGVKHPLDSEVSFGVEHVDDPADCGQASREGSQERVSAVR
ncbi:MAG: protein kinase domain-containing protein [Stackebrandtia sp.]